jgi:Pentapeptide repeats (8 copies)
METIMNKTTGSLRRHLRISTVGLAVTGLLAIGIGDAFAGSRGGGRMAGTSVSGANRASAGNMNRANTGNVNRGNVNTGNANRGNVNTGNVNRGNVNTGNVNRGNVNTGNINVGNDVNIDIDRDFDYDRDWGDYYHPVATAAVIGAVAVTTAAVVGSYYYTLPPGCTAVIKNGVTYHYCGTVYYQKTMSGNEVVYVVVNP